MENNLEHLAPFASARQLEYLAAIKEHGTMRKAALALDLSRGTISNSLTLLSAKAARQGVSPEHDMVHPVPEGFYLKGTSTYYNKEGKPAGQWVKNNIDLKRQEDLWREAIAAFSSEVPAAAPVVAAPPGDTDLCNLIVFTDYHVGQLSWGKECGEDWDLEKAESLLLASFRHLITNAPSAHKLVLCLQGDFMHTDGLRPLTPEHKNLLDAAGRFSKIVAVAIRVIRAIVQEALMCHPEVRLVICEGNHDEASSMWLRHLFAAQYDKEPRLSVNDSELPFYVEQHGDTMIGFHHGHKVKNEGLPLLFAAQFAKIWGSTEKRYVHCGHRHHVDEKEYAGMTVVQHPTLVARDAHSARGGYVSNRAAQLITYHTKYGQVSRTFVCPEMFKSI